MPYCVVEEHRVLRNNSNTLAQTVEADRINWVATQADVARLRLEKSWKEQRVNKRKIIS